MTALRRLIETIVREMLGSDAADVLTSARRLTRGGTVPAGSVGGTLPTPVQQAIDHGNLAGLADDDHGQYLNTTRHDTTTRHALGTVVAHDALDSLTNVLITSVAEGQSIRWDDAASKWVNYTPPTSGEQLLDDDWAALTDDDGDYLYE